MYVKKNFNFASIFMFSWFHIVWLTIWAFITAWFYGTFHFEWMNIPWLPLSILGTAVAFYIGFKNNSAYDRLWEARKIWGGIVNNSRSFIITLKDSFYIHNSEVSKNEFNHFMYLNFQVFIFKKLIWIKPCY